MIGVIANIFPEQLNGTGQRSQWIFNFMGQTGSHFTYGSHILNTLYMALHNPQLLAGGSDLLG